MTTYADVHTRVSMILVSPSPSVEAAIPQLVLEAQLEAERRYDFSAMRGELLLETVPGSTIARQYAASPFRRVFLRPDLHRHPYHATWSDLPVYVATNNIIVENEFQNDLLIKVYSTTPNFRDLGFRLGMVVAWSAATPTIGLAPCRVSNVPYGGLQLWLRFDDRTIAPFQTIVPPAGISCQTVIGMVPTSKTPLAWTYDSDALYATSQVEPTLGPSHIERLEPSTTPVWGIDDYGSNQDAGFRIYPVCTTPYVVHIPCYFHIGASLVNPETATLTNWWTAAGFKYLAYRAAAEGFALELDGENEARWRQRAEAELQMLVKQDKAARFTTRTMRMSQDALGTVQPVTPRR